MSREVTVKLVPNTLQLNEGINIANPDNFYTDENSDTYAEITYERTSSSQFSVETGDIPADAVITNVQGKVKLFMGENVHNVVVYLFDTVKGEPIAFGYTYDLYSDPPMTEPTVGVLNFVDFDGNPFTDWASIDVHNNFALEVTSLSTDMDPPYPTVRYCLYGASIEITYLTDTPEPEPPTPDMSHNISVGPDMTDHSIMNALNIKYGLNLGSGGSIVDKLNAIIVQNGGEAHPAATIAELIKLLPESGVDPKEQAIDTIVSLLSWAINADITHSKELKEQAKSDLEGGFRSFLMVSDKEAVLQAAESLSTTESSLWGMGVEHMLSQAVSGNFITNDAAANIMSFFQTTPK